MKMLEYDGTITIKDEEIWEKDLKDFIKENCPELARLEGHTKINLENLDGINNYFNTVTGNNAPSNIIYLINHCPSGVYAVVSEGLYSNVFSLEQILFRKLYGNYDTDGIIKSIFVVVRHSEKYKSFLICNLYLYENVKKIINRLGKYIYPENLHVVKQMSNYNPDWGYEMVKDYFSQIWELNPNESVFDLHDFLNLMDWNPKIIELIPEEELLKVFNNSHNQDIFRNYTNFTYFIECLNALPEETKNKVWKQIIEENTDILKAKGFMLKYE